MGGFGDDPEPIHGWFGLSYANYLVLPRAILQSMPRGWQVGFVAHLERLNELYPDLDLGYWVRAQKGGKFIHDPYSDYERGRRFVPPTNNPSSPEQPTPTSPTPEPPIEEKR